MEKKRRLPPRAAARAEQVSKKRTTTPSVRSATGTPAPEAEPMAIDESVTTLPKSVQAGKPLPTVETPQLEELPYRDFQSIQESGVLAESLTRSRQKWISEGIFEKYWTKPSKRKGAVKEDNPPKESMIKLGQVTITVEPHVFEATMFAVKDPKPLLTMQPQARPVLQYGPPNGIMPPPRTPTPTRSVAAQTATAGLQPDVKPGSSVPQTAAFTGLMPAAQVRAPQTSPPPQPPPTQSARTPPPAPVPPGSLSTPAASPVAPAATIAPGATSTSLAAQPQPSGTVASGMPPTGRPHGAPNTLPVTPGPPHVTANGPAPAAAAGKPPPSRDPIILTLAEKAGEDSHLRDLMKRVAQGDAAKHELEQFQAIIDAITIESKRKGGPVGPPADRLFVDSRTVRYFADEVRAILNIVLQSNPKQTSADLRPPPGSDLLVVELVKAALDDAKISNMVRRIAEDRPLNSDAADLKATLDRLNKQICPEVISNPKANGCVNDHVAQASSASSSASPASVPQQALRSRGPPPTPKPDISGVVFEFAGGNGDRYLFPKFSILEYVTVPSGQQVIASFLVVLKGSKSEYPVADAALDYYQPVTIRLYTPLGRHLENLARVVAPQDEVRRYMDDVMEKMTRAEYVLLAMRLPRSDRATGDGPETDEADSAKGKEHGQDRAGSAPKQGYSQHVSEGSSPIPHVLWAGKPSSLPDARQPAPRAKVGAKTSDAQDEEYQNFIASVSQKSVEEV